MPGTQRPGAPAPSVVADLERRRANARPIPGTRVSEPVPALPPGSSRRRLFELLRPVRSAA